MFVKDPQVIVTYTGGICGTMILFLVPITVVSYGRLRGFNKVGENFNESPFQSWFWVGLCLTFALVTLFFVILSIIQGNTGE